MRRGNGKGFDASFADGEVAEDLLEFLMRQPDGRHRIEVKRDMFFSRTGNFAFEIEDHGRESGLLTTDADVWLHYGSGDKHDAIDRETGARRPVWGLWYDADQLRARLFTLWRSDKAELKMIGDDKAALNIIVKATHLISSSLFVSVEQGPTSTFWKDQIRYLIRWWHAANPTWVAPTRASRFSMPEPTTTQVGPRRIYKER